MKKSGYFIGAVSAAIAITFCGVTVLAKEKEGKNAEEREVSVDWEQLPQPVQQNIQVQLNTIHPERLTQESDDGFTAYEAAKTINGQLKEIKLGSNGQLLEIEDTVAVSDLPVEVKASVEKKYPKSGIVKACRVTCYYYEVEIGPEKHSKELKVLGNGQEFEEED